MIDIINNTSEDIIIRILRGPVTGHSCLRKHRHTPCLHKENPVCKLYEKE